MSILTLGHQHTIIENAFAMLVSARKALTTKDTKVNEGIP
jgi:hypothetical protein